MAGFLVLALAIPRAFARRGAAFGLAYLVVVLVHAGLFTRSASESVVRAILGLAPFNVATALLMLVAGSSAERAEYVLLALPFALEWVSPSPDHDRGVRDRRRRTSSSGTDSSC